MLPGFVLMATGLTIISSTPTPGPQAWQAGAGLDGAVPLTAVTLVGTNTASRGGVGSGMQGASRGGLFEADPNADTVVEPVAGLGLTPLPAPADPHTQVPLNQPGNPAVALPANPTPGSTGVTRELAGTGIPLRVFRSYVAAERTMATFVPECHLSWSLLAAIGRVESNHGRFGGAVVGADGTARPPIYGPALDGANGTAAIGDTDRGRLDGLTTGDRAVGPMQFIPGTWARFGTDGNGDGVADPQNVDDASITAARYLCYGHGDLTVEGNRWRAVLSYNQSTSYAAQVLALADSYAAGTVVPLPAVPPGVVPPTPTVSPSRSSPSASRSPSPSLSPSPSRSPSPSVSPSPSLSPSPSVSPSPSSSPSPSASPSPSVSPTSPSPSSSPSPSGSPSPSDSPSPSSSPAPSPSPSDTPTPTPTPPTQSSPAAVAPASVADTPVVTATTAPAPTP
jgi:hypothetical protein